MKKRSYFSKSPQSKLLIIFSSTRLHYRVKEKGQTMDPSITTFKLKDMAIMQTHIIPLLRKNDSGNNILKTSTVSYQQLKIVSINLLSRHSSKWHFLLNIIHDKNHEDELAYLMYTKTIQISGKFGRRLSQCLPCFKEVIAQIFQTYSST